MVLGLLCAFAAGAEDVDDIPDIETNLERAAKLIRSGEMTIKGSLSMDYRTGRYHTIHVDAMGLDCASCHYGDVYRANYMLLRRDEQLRKRAKGQVSRQTCVACHQAGGFATTFYMMRPGERVESAVKR
jgi:hypothetical protein